MHNIWHCRKNQCKSYQGSRKKLLRIHLYGKQLCSTGYNTYYILYERLVDFLAEHSKACGI